MLSTTEENYIKAIFQIAFEEKNAHPVGVGTNELAAHLSIKPASANSMLKKLKEKGLIDYKKYGKISLTPLGRTCAISLVRKHRLWETFLYEKLEFTWDEVHEIAEELEHINSEKLIDRLDKLLNYPKYDPHGDPIPTKEGKLGSNYKKTLFEVAVGTCCKMVAVRDNSRNFLQYVISLGLAINNKIRVISRQDYDHSTVIEVEGKRHSVSQKFCENIYVI